MLVLLITTQPQITTPRADYYPTVSATANVKYSASVSGSTSHPRVCVSAAQISAFVPQYKAAKVTVSNGSSSATYQYPASSTGPTGSNNGGRRSLKQMSPKEMAEYNLEMALQEAMGNAVTVANNVLYDLCFKAIMLPSILNQLLHGHTAAVSLSSGPASGGSCYQF